MTLTIKKGDFIEMDFTAKIAATGAVFDTTREHVASEHHIKTKESKYKPIIIAAGHGQLVKGLDAFIIGKTPGTYTATIDAVDAFGKKDAKLLRLISAGEFRKHKINPMPGLEVDLDGSRGIVRTVNGGRVIVDFNHPLSSQDVTYDIEIKRIVTDDKERITAVMEFYHLPCEKITIENEKATIGIGTLKSSIPDDLAQSMCKEISTLTGIKDVELV